MNDGKTSPISNATAQHPLRIGDPAPDFQARTSQGEVRLSDFRGKWLLFFSHPADFTPVCTSEFLALTREYARFEAMECALLGLSVDSLYSHLAWLEAIRTRFGVEIPFPVVEDPSMAVGQAYGMLAADAHDSATVRATYFIDPMGIVRAIIWYPMSVGRSVDELLRLLAALQRSADGDVMTPEGWRPGDDVLAPVPLTQDDVRDATGCWFYPATPDHLSTGK
ncbi:peroxiredoxin [Novacetimonas hansenii]|uniref:Thioredoxin peroxidase n=1 Tax=Novacetimonas hansenii TaxID=436 RepID=A0AAW5EXL0_NOVHA|nr:peroxiredoxin [Novacetimonas hansenii]MCJ8355264.1 peroxiredoxin [Novacetimonas hansenii]QOF95826.1 peroxiredoxin [Novacetimonas hansenii]